MPKLTKLVCSTACAALMTGSAVHADVTAQQVWGDWKSYMEGFGYDISATEATSGGTLTVSGMTMSLKLPEEEGTMSFTVDQISFANRGDGTVEVTIPPVLPIKVNIDAEGDKVEALIEYSQQGFSTIVSGDAQSMTYSYSAAELGVALGALTVDGKPVDIGTARMDMQNLTGSSATKIGNLRTIDQTFNIAGANIAVDMKDPEGSDGKLVLNSALTGVTFGGTSTIPAEMDPENMDAMLKAGFGFDGSFGHGGAQTEMQFTENGETVNIASSSSQGELGVAMDARRLHYFGNAANSVINLAGGDIPFPVQLTLAETAFNLLAPIGKSDEEQDFAFALKLGDFQVPEMLWGMVDPTNQLPHDPATISLDLSGKAKVLFDMFDPTQMDALESSGTQPGEVNSLAIKDVTVRAVGAELTGQGDFTFDNTDTESFDGMPRPEGAIELKLVGGNGLLDKLIAMGFVSEDDAMGARMMMGLFAVPGQGEDTLNSKIEVNAEGHVMANGQRIK